MSRQTYVLSHRQARERALMAVRDAPDGYVVQVRPKTRTLEQNARLWAMLGDIARQVVWHGRRLTAENWKDIFSAALKRQEVVPGIDGGFVVMGQSTSRMTVREMGDMMELISAFSAEQGVQ